MINIIKYNNIFQKYLFFFYKFQNLNALNNLFIVKKWYLNFNYVIKYKNKNIIYLNNFKHRKLFLSWLRNFFLEHFIKSFFIKNIEKSLQNYVNTNVFISINMYTQKLGIKKIKYKLNTYKNWTGNGYYPFEVPILSSKIIADLICYHIELVYSARSIQYIMRIIRTWQMTNNYYSLMLQKMYNSKFNSYFYKFIHNYGMKKYPLLGLRIECSGTPKKGKRKKKWFYGDIISHYSFLSGKAPNNSFSADLDYYQSYATTLSSSIGIKVWTFYKTHFCNRNGKIISLILTE
jgi:hypothetical protein